MNYQSGKTIVLGDQVLIERGATPGEVTDVIETPAQWREWNVGEPGVMVKAAPFGLVFWPSAHTDPLVFVARGEVAN